MRMRRLSFPGSSGHRRSAWHVAASALNQLDFAILVEERRWVLDVLAVDFGLAVGTAARKNASTYSDTLLDMP
jgi:hypothetical protein